MRFNLCIFLPLAFGRDVAEIFRMAKDHTEERCYCWNEFDDAMKRAVESIPPPLPIPNSYEYVGVKIDNSGNLKGCICDDVTSVVSEIRLMEAEFRMSLKSRITDQDSKERKLSNAFKSIVQSTTPSDIINVTATLVKAETNSTIWQIEVVVKGKNSNVPSDITSRVKSSITTTGSDTTLLGIGQVDASTINFIIYPCGTPIPPKAPKNSQVDWDGSRAVGAKAVYTCVTGYESKKVTEQNATSRCIGKGWLAVRLSCPKIECSNTSLAGLPNYGDFNWTIGKPKGVYGDKVLYYCQDNYNPSVKDIESTCNETGGWSDISSYECISDDYERIFIWYDRIEQERLKKPVYQSSAHNIFNFDSEDEDNWFYLVTIPSVIGLVILLLCCVCCTRIDSPFFFPCSDDQSKWA